MRKQVSLRKNKDGRQGKVGRACVLESDLPGLILACWLRSPEEITELLPWPWFSSLWNRPNVSSHRFTGRTASKKTAKQYEALTQLPHARAFDPAVPLSLECWVWEPGSLSSLRKPSAKRTPDTGPEQTSPHTHQQSPKHFYYLKEVLSLSWTHSLLKHLVGVEGKAVEKTPKAICRHLTIPTWDYTRVCLASAAIHLPRKQMLGHQAKDGNAQASCKRLKLEF